jgi:hypothetical protein
MSKSAGNGLLPMQIIHGGKVSVFANHLARSDN